MLPGIVGCVTHKLELEPNLISAMVEPMLHRSNYGVSTHTESKFSIATIDLAQNYQNGRAESRDQRHILFFFGQFMNLG